MTQFDRRQFFSAAFGAAGITAAPAWCSRWFGPQDPKAPTREEQLRTAVATAKAHGKPLLVFVVPGDGTENPEVQREAAERGRWFGALLNHGGQLALLEVALCVPACARLDEVQRVTGAAPIEGAPVLLVIDVAGVGVEGVPAPKVTPLALTLGSPFGAFGRGGAESAEAEQERRRIEAKLEALTTGLTQTMHRHGASMAALATTVNERLSPEQRERLQAWLAGDAGPSEELLVRCAAEIRRAIGDEPDAQRRAMQRRLVAAVESVIVKQPLAGGRWYQDMGCGSRPEVPTADEKNGAMVACGMGSVPIHCDRFLGLWTEG